MRGAAGLAAALWLCGNAVFAEPIIVGADYTAPTTRYPHGVLGDNVEYGRLNLRFADQPVQKITLPQDHVFEDVAPRLWDVTGDGLPEVVVIESDAGKGAALVVYGPDGKLAETPHIGTRNRWLAPIAAADLDGDGHVEIAYIDRPHLAKTLRVWRFKDGALSQIAAVQGLTNHKIGWAFIAGGLRACDGPELITADANWRRIIATRFADGVLKHRDLGAYRGPESLDHATEC